MGDRISKEEAALSRIFGNDSKLPEGAGEPVKLNTSEMRVGEHVIKLGSFQVVHSFTSLSIPLALYALQQMMLEIKVPFVVNYKDFSSPPPQHVIEIDVNKSSTTFINYFTMYREMMLTVHLSSGALLVTAYADDEVSGTKFFEELEAKIRTCNFYRGKCLYFSGDEIAFKKPPTLKWEEVIIESNLKKEIRLNAESFFFNEEYRRMGLFKRGIILHGPPGTGKTSIVRAVFSSLEKRGITRVYLTNETFSRIDMSTFFKTLEYLLPAVVVFEDIDLIGANRNISRSRIIGALLNHMDGVDKVSEPLVIFGTTNDFEALDEALRNRPARFDRCLKIGAPNAHEIIQFYEKLAKIKPSDELVELSKGFTGAHIEETVNTAFMLALQDGKTKKEDISEELLQRNLTVAAKRVSSNFPLNKDGDKVGFGKSGNGTPDSNDEYFGEIEEEKPADPGMSPLMPHDVGDMNPNQDNDV
jgi:hypothetical protein